MRIDAAGAAGVHAIGSGDRKIRAPGVPSGWQKPFGGIAFGESLNTAMMAKAR